MRWFAQCTALTLAAGVAVNLCAQDPIGDLQQVDQGVADGDRLSTSLRVVDGGLALPQGFQQLYQVPGSGDKLMRASGAIYAIFPRSSYVSSRYGEVAAIPAGTVFSIGLPPELVGSFAQPGEHRRESELLVRPRLDTGAVRAVPYEPAPRRPPRSQFEDLRNIAVPVAIRAGGPAIVIDERYRETRLRELMDRAAASHRGS